MTATFPPPTLGPCELRIRWEYDDDPDYFDDLVANYADLTEDARREAEGYVEQYGIYGCIVETRPPACACCGSREWEEQRALWGIVGDDHYHREVEGDLMAEVAHAQAAEES